MAMTIPKAHSTNAHIPEPPATCNGTGWVRWFRFALVVSLGMLVGSCALLRHESSETKSILGSITGDLSRGRGTNTADALQMSVMRFADEYVAAIAQATDDFRERVPTLEARDAAQKWKLMEGTSAFINASGENPALNAVDMVVLATLSRDVVADYWVGQKFGDSARPLLKTQIQLESNAWRIVHGILSPEQHADLESMLTEYTHKYPDSRYVAAARLPELAATLERAAPTTPQQRRSGNLLSLLYLDPLTGLDPATRAIDQTRNLAQRAMYYAQRMPMLLSWQVELTTYQLAAQPGAREILSSVETMSDTGKEFTTTLRGLPQLVNDQREAAINQLLAGVAQERANIISNINSQELRLRELLPQVQQTLATGGETANSINSAVQSLDAFVRYVSLPDTNAPVATTDEKPFDVLDYGKAADHIGLMAKALNELLVSVNQSLPQATQLGQQVGLDARGVLNHAFRLGLLLIGAAGLVAVLVVWISHKLTGRSTNHSPSGTT